MKESQVWKLNGFLGILIIAVFIALGAVMLINTKIVLGIFFVAAAFILASGITIVQPNKAGVVIFFGKYLGTIRDSGMFLTVPFSLRRTVSLRVNNFNSKKLKVNDVEGNPIEIAAVVVYK